MEYFPIEITTFFFLERLFSLIQSKQYKSTILTSYRTTQYKQKHCTSTHPKKNKKRPKPRPRKKGAAKTIRIENTIDMTTGLSRNEMTIQKIVAPTPSIGHLIWDLWDIKDFYAFLCIGLSPPSPLTKEEKKKWRGGKKKTNSFENVGSFWGPFVLILENHNHIFYNILAFKDHR